MMRASRVILSVIGTVALICLLSSCYACRNLEGSMATMSKDSVRTEVREKTIYVTDTVTVEIPMQTAERIAKDSASHLENDYAMSDVRLNADGTLYHHLSTKPQKKPMEIQKPIQQRDSIVYRYITRNVKKTVVEKERLPLTWWEKTRIYGFYLLLVWLVLNYRKQVVRLITGLRW